MAIRDDESSVQALAALHTSMIHWLLGAVGAFFAWLAWEIIGDAIAEIFSLITAPVRRPLWRAFGRARWPWPLLLMLVGGGAVSVLGLSLTRLEEGGWRSGLGLILFLVGAIFAVSSGYLWRDARRDAALEARRAPDRSATRVAS